MKSKIAQFIKESVAWLVENQQGCCHYKLDEHLAVCVGWSAGYGDEKRNDVIQGEDALDWGIDAGIKVWTSDAAMLTDYDWINFPYYQSGDVIDTGITIARYDNYENIAKYLLNVYDEVKNLELADDGLILWRNEE